MKYIKSYNESVASIIGDIVGPLLTMGLIYGFYNVKKYIDLNKFKTAQNKLSDVIAKVEMNSELEDMLDKVADMVENDLIETIEFKNLCKSIRSKMRQYLTKEEYDRWDEFTSKYMKAFI